MSFEDQIPAIIEQVRYEKRQELSTADLLLAYDEVVARYGSMGVHLPAITVSDREVLTNKGKKMGVRTVVKKLKLVNPNVDTKMCRVCGEEKLYREFPISPQNIDGYNNRCKKCCSEYQKAYWANNK
jgi:hypothetical protein